MRIRTILLIVFLLIFTNLVTFMGASAFMEDNTQSQVKENADIFEEFDSEGDLELLEDVLGILENKYLEEVDRGELMEGALEGMLETLDDPQTNYLTPRDYQDLMVRTEGSYGGIGIEVFMDEDYVTIVAPISGTPGEEKGLRSGDRIISIDGDDIVGIDLQDAVDKMRGEPGSTVEIEIERPGLDENMEFEITRQDIEIETVNHEMKENDLGYIEITNFSQTTGEEFSEAITELEQGDMEGLVLDLRDNPGGLLNAAIEVGQEIVPAGPIVHVVGRQDTLETHESFGDGVDYPMVVLVNQNSASASEILAGALQDTETATIAGSTTFGKASVQNVEPLAHGGALQYTMAKYQTPDGRDIHEEGLNPDVEIDPPKILELTRQPISTDLSMGDEGEEVETLQSILKELDYFTEEVTGEFDEHTRDALEKFQQARGISATGEMEDMVIREFHDMIEEYLEEDDEKLERGLEILLEKVTE
ncbi:S41 family peptidase [Natranaerobius thermophilus]|uniref:Carboxyl-terminal protease n=1 Tax=Natranaerobius thermophilus (strain ATCC BAA-1301 / DSM 18059 / JW/NM-WN-LF) TaxID=457570 RepID=B2A7Y7_NATTJ|nr:S41 family peptidase [Natranaerobius thermophilus]ACB85759.1 carboxyl-terminal protease [Natranaerobius thermophilus JW/NM-WN-LF]